MSRIAALLLSGSDRLRTRCQGGIVKASHALEAEPQITLGVAGSPGDRSRPGEPPRRQSGQLGRDTKVVADPTSLTIHVTTSPVGFFTDRGTRRMAARPWLAASIARTAAARKRLIFDRR